MSEKRKQRVKSKGNGEGTIYENKKTGLLIGQYVPKGLSKRVSVYQKKSETKTQFKDRFRKILTDNDLGLHTDDVNSTMLTILEEHIEYKHNNNITSDRTYRRDKDTLKQLQATCLVLISKPIQKITVRDIQNASPNITKFSQNTIDKLWRFLRTAIKIAVSRHLLFYNIMDSTELKKPLSQKETKPVEALTIDEQKRFIPILKKSNNLYNDILLIQLYTGMRIGEVLALSTSNIDLSNDTIRVERTLTRDEKDKVILGKTTKTINGIREIPITPFIKPILKRLLSNKVANMYSLLFYDYEDNTFITPNEINCYLQRLNKKHKFCEHIHTHMLRHSYATRCIEAGMSAKVLQKLLGHSKIETTLNTYASVFSQFQKSENDKYIDYMKKVMQ